MRRWRNTTANAHQLGGVSQGRQAFVEEGRREGVRCPYKVIGERYNEVCERIVGVAEPREEGEICNVGEEEQRSQECPGYEERVTWSASNCET